MDRLYVITAMPGIMTLYQMKFELISKGHIWGSKTKKILWKRPAGMCATVVICIIDNKVTYS